MGRVLVAEDEEGVRSFLVEALERAGHDVVAVEDGLEALDALRDGGIELVLTDLRMPAGDGMSVLRAARAGGGDVEVVVLTSFGDVKTAVEAMKLGAYDYLEKPVASPAAVRALADEALRHREELRADDGTGHRPLPPPSSRSPRMRAVEDALAKVAKTATTVLLQGESGTGKEIAARAIHDASPRASGPFVAINCAVLSEALLESELFGHEKGAFTGAHARRSGRIEMADGGTFFLDEVGELQPSLQAKLLRVIEERSFERVGGSRPIGVDVRFIAATHRDLRAMVRAGAFREDMYHRLAVFPVTLPPLRERREDIVPIAEVLLARLATAGRPVPTLSAAAKGHLVAAPWPGNIRELRNVLERAIILADGGVLDVPHLALDGTSERGPEGSAVDVTPRLEDLERAAIERALAANGGNRREAASQLGIGLRTLYEKIKRYGLR